MLFVDYLFILLHTSKKTELNVTFRFFCFSYDELFPVNMDLFQFSSTVTIFFLSSS